MSKITDAKNAANLGHAMEGIKQSFGDAREWLKRTLRDIDKMRSIEGHDDLVSLPENRTVDEIEAFCKEAIKNYPLKEQE